MMEVSARKPNYLREEEEQPARTHTVKRAGGPAQCAWSPYDNNGGTILAVAGTDFAVLAADTRMTRGYSIISRNVHKWSQLTSKVCIVTAGMRADMETLHKNMKAKITKYIFDHRKEPSINALGQLLSTMLYSRRFFPYYTFNSLVGLDEKGEGVIYSYDAVGNSEPIKYDAEGSGKELATPILDARLKASNQLIKPDALDLQGVKDLCADALTAAAERDILTGDFGEIVVISRDGIKLETFSLRQD